MPGFSEVNFVKKLAELNSSQQSIQTLSLWLIHHRKHADMTAKVWRTEFLKASSSRKLTFIYLANDVIQNGRKKGLELTDAFAEILPGAFEHATMDTDANTSQKLQRLIKIWQERKIFNKDVLEKLETIIANNEPAAKKVRIEEVKRALQLHADIAKDSESDVCEEPPEADDVVKLIADLSQSASSDAEIRQKIANLPAEVSDASHLKKITDKKQADALASTVAEAYQLLEAYNKRLTSELTDRKNLSGILPAFVTVQKDQLAAAQTRLQEFKQKLYNVTTARKELEHHIQNLPDLSRLPDADAGLAPLPSAGDLFSL